MNRRTEIKIKLKDLIEFIYRSKGLCFAATDEKISLSDGTSIYSNRELPWLYNDIYCGNTVERGTEDVYFDMILVWSLQYRGGVIEEFYKKENYQDTACVVAIFLKKALMNLSRDFPARGPNFFKSDHVQSDGKIYRGEFIYINQWNGDIKKFIGHEEIIWDGKTVYYHDYMGGLVRNKYFPVIIF